jgi:hypothetical protein
MSELDNLKELALLARQEGDEELELKALERIAQIQGDQSPSDQHSVAVPAGTGRSASGQKRREERLATERALQQYEAGQLTSADVTLKEMEQIRTARIEAIPEITGSFKELSKDLGFTQALAGMTAFDPDEFGQILTAADPNIGVVTTPEGERLAINRATNEMMSINKAGPSLMDAIQFGGAAAMFTPSGALRTVGQQVLGAAGTQATIETGQALAGGEFDPVEVAIAGGAVPVVSGAVKYGKGAIENFRRSVRSRAPLINIETGVAQPSFQKALDEYDIDIGALVDDQANLPVIYSGDKPSEVVENIVKKQIKTGKSPGYLAKIRLDDKGKIIDDDLGTIAIKQGFDPGDIAAVKQANKATRLEEQRMLKMQRAIMADRSKVDEFRPSDVVGDSVMDRVNFVRNEANKLSDKLHKMASKELTISGRKLIGDGDRLKGLAIDPTKVEQTVFDELDKLNIQSLDDILSGKGEPIFNAIDKKGFFDGSAIDVDPTSQKIIKSVFKLLRHNPDGPIDALRAHNVKRQIDSLIDFNKKSSTGLTDEGRKFALAVRRAMNDSIREVSPKYAKINDDLSTALQALNAVEDSVARRIDLFDEGASQAVGTDMRKLLSNYGTRQTLNNSLNTLDNAAKLLGGAFDTNFRELNRFANVLDKRFGSVAKNSFTENINAALDLNRLRSTSVTEAVVEKGLSKVTERFRPTDREALDTMNKILIRGK